MPSTTESERMQYQAGRMEEFMRHTRDDVQLIKGGIERLHVDHRALQNAVTEHSVRSVETAKDLGEIKAAMGELHSCMQHLRVQRASNKGRWKSIGIGAASTVGVLTLLVTAMAGKDGDVLSTLSLILGILM